MPESHVLLQPRQQERRRARELYQYFNPSDIEFAQLSFTSPEPPSQKPRNVDSSLAAFCHLVAIRLNMKRALVRQTNSTDGAMLMDDIISLIGDGTQYSIAESTRTLSLGNEDQFEDEGDGLWISCSSYPQGGLLCERTVALPPSKGSYSCFTVQDLSTDNRFKHLPFVAEHPHYRFYVGTPLTTKQGINIGSLCLLDNKVHDDLTASQLDFLGTMAATCMNHLEMKREAYEGRMIKKMRNGLRCFVEGRSWYAEDNDTEPGLTKELETSPKIQRVDHTFSPKVDERKNFNSAFQNTNKPSSPLASAPEVLLGQTSLQEQPEPITDRQLLFGRAANLLRESLGLDKTGCVTFLDTERQLVYSPSDNVGGTVASTRNNSSEGRRFSLPSIVSSTRNMHKTSPKHLPATILAFSTADHPLSSSCISNMPFLPVPENIVEDLCKRYPRGRIWHFDESGNASSEDDQIYKTLDGEHDTGVSLRTNKIHSKDMEAKTLQRYLPSVRQLAFMPMWDSASSKWYCGAFIWSSDETRVFTLDRELDFLGAFSKSVMVEVSRLAAILSDEQKGDFIGSISHELRSPLHGILASVDFFSDTHLSTFQQSLVDQIDSCGRTLLDTINHVLDFSKINAFERGWKNKVHKKTGKGVPSDRNLSQGLPSALSIYAVTNVAGICEEVIEGVAAGHLFQELTSSVGKFQVFSGIPEAGLQSNKNVDMVLSIEPGDWVFVTQPGALRRVIMNLFGNSLKYTNKGSVMVHLQQTDTKKMVEGQETQKQIILTITDTGKGISEQYLRTKLFTPFSQENSLAPGTGLGLSLVKSIVNMLDGKIDICSRVDEGTEVQICIPLHRPLPGSDTPASTPDSSQTNRSEDLIGRLPSVISGKSITFYRDGSPAGGISNMASSSKTVFRYITTWFNTVVLDWGTVIRPDIIFVEETDLDDLVRLCKAQDARNTPAIIVLCHQARRHNSVYEKKYDGVVEYLSKPFGPIKLAKALIFCLEGIAARNDGIVPLANEDGSYAIENPTSATPLVNEITLDPAADLPPIIVEADRVVVAREGPLNEQQALDTTAGYLNAKTDTNGTEDFPFPNSDALKEPSASIIKVDHYTNGVDELMLRPSDKRLMESQPDRLPFSRGVTPIALQHLGGLSSNTREQIPQRLSPRILLVDDNRINLRLLQTLMRKRKYTMVDSAENGLEAVKAAENNPLGYDIILMDLSMPILNGFEATSRIRDLEAVRAAEASPLDTFKPALIIALTGLASNRDRNEAFQAGVDLYMTKPVSFKEVGVLLDNWEKNAVDRQ
ncbi:MAG: hypothetical protein M1834_000158 [Cirrosporium novae-zelandiae]|nr:MAG: hypothetical protein M1834_000158 [Cirrosporium novae-zelandiae]